MDEASAVTADAIRTGAPVPPRGRAEDQRRAWLGGWYSAQRPTPTENPYSDFGCREAWQEGYIEGQPASTPAS